MADLYFIGQNALSDWYDANNWSNSNTGTAGNSVPKTPADTAYVYLAPTFQLSSKTLKLKGLVLSSARGEAKLQLFTGTKRSVVVIANKLILAEKFSPLGKNRITVIDGSKFIISGKTGNAVIGQGGFGRVELIDSVFKTAKTLIIGKLKKSQGIVTSNHSRVQAANVFLGWDPGAVGEFRQGQNAITDIRGNFQIGFGGTGVVVLQGGEMTVTPSWAQDGSVYLGNSVGAKGVLLVHAGTLSAKQIIVGGDLSRSPGGTGWLMIGSQSKAQVNSGVWVKAGGHVYVGPKGVLRAGCGKNDDLINNGSIENDGKIFLGGIVKGNAITGNGYVGPCP